jgi:hypothetical protein
LKLSNIGVKGNTVVLVHDAVSNDRQFEAHDKDPPVNPCRTQFDPFKFEPSQVSPGCILPSPHVFATAHKLDVHVPEQHVAPVEQAPPLAVHDPEHAKLLHVPEEQSVLATQD